MINLARSLVIVFAVVAAAQAPAQEREEVLFELTQVMAGPQEHAFVLGDLPELGGGDLLQAVKLQASDSVHWSVTISLPVNRTYSYQFYRRFTGQVPIGDPNNGTPIGPVLTGSTATVSLEPPDKTVHCYSELDPPHLHWRQGSGGYEDLAMSELGPGRTPAEARWIAAGLGESRRAVEFYFTDAQGGARDPATGTYETLLDEPFVQDGAVFSYVPAPAVSPVRRDYVITSPLTIASTILGATRTYRVMLPRGYDEHTERRYPVLYQYDGLILWDGLIAGGAFDYDLDAANMAGLVSSGQVGEMILVAIDPLGTPGTCAYTSNRARDCLSPEDTVNVGCGLVAGMADQFGAFIRDELKVVIDGRYRTLPDKEHTFAQGYSFGGVFAMYMGWEFSGTFGGVGSQSGSFWVQHFPDRIKLEPKRDVRIYIDTGTLNKGTIYNTVLPLRDNLVGKAPPYVEEGDLRFRIGYGHNHTFFNGGQRLPQLATFLYPATAETAGVFAGHTYCASTTNSSGHAARIRASGSTSVSANDTRLHALLAPAHAFGLFVYGQAAGQLPFGDGYLCVDPFAPGIHRLFPLATTDGSGLANFALDLGTLPPGGAINAGSTWHFQYLFRDLSAGGTGFNGSDGVRLTFEP